MSDAVTDSVGSSVSIDGEMTEGAFVGALVASLVARSFRGGLSWRLCMYQRGCTSIFTSCTIHC